MLKDRLLDLLAKFTAIVCLFTLVSYVTACSPAEEADKNAVAPANLTHSDKRVSLFEDKVSFIPPAKFAVLKTGKLKKKLAENDSPQYIFANPKQTGLVLVYYNEAIELKPEKLEEVKRFVEGIHRNYSNWLTSQIVEANGRKWFQFEWETPKKSELELLAPEPEDNKSKMKTQDEKQIHYYEYTTSFDNKLLRFVFEADADEYSKLKAGLMKSAQTIQIKN